MAVCADCGVESGNVWSKYYGICSICSKCETKKIHRAFNPFKNNLVEKPEILTSDQEAQVSRLVNTYGMDREDAITSLQKFWANQ